MMSSSPRPSALIPPSLDRLLACAALRKDLGSLVLYDAASELLECVADVWGGQLAAVLGQPVHRVWLSSWTTEEDLWGVGDALPAPLGRPGLIVDEGPRLVVIPDLTRLSLAGLRACVALMDSEVAAIEREGQSRRFQPRCYWLASCSLAEVGQVSPHLLDRFALRVRAPAVHGNRVAALERALEEAHERSPASGSKEEVSSGPDATRWVQAAHVAVRLTAEASEAAVARLPHISGTGHRGLLTLTRLACALAQLEYVEHSGTQVTPVYVQSVHINEAAQLLQLPAHGDETSQNPTNLNQAEQEAKYTRAPKNVEAQEEPASNTTTLVAPAQLPLAEAEEMSPQLVRVEPVAVSQQECQPIATLAPLEVERATPVQREHTPLRLPSFRGTRERGSIIGARPAMDLRDLAIVPTLLAAAPYQRIRRKQAGTPQRKKLLLTNSDLRAWVRSPIPQQLLVLVLDFTCEAPSNWQRALLPYLSEAYVERAPICIIQVGAQGAESELRAQRVLARNVLVPAVAQALEAKAGRATPLADGLELAMATLRRLLRVGRQAALHARLVLFTDGRGNIPLEASRIGHLQGPVAIEGVEDALRIAAQLRGMRQVTSVLLRPPGTVLGQLPVLLADALGAELVDVMPSVRVEGEMP
jgi:magnesium chelatase subunit D